MTKDAEIKMLDAAIAQFGPQSYLGPWLAEHRESIVTDIRNDFQPTAPMPAEARRLAAQILLDANAAAAIVKSDAAVKAHDMIAVADGKVATIRERARRELVKMADGL